MDLNEVIKEYVETRYLRKASDADLSERLTYLGANLWSTDKDGSVTQPRSLENRLVIIRLYVHTLYEQSCRTDFDIQFDEAAIRTEASASYVRPNLKLPIEFDPICFAKFGKSEHLVPMLEQGVIRIAPAASYADSSLNSAQMDEELKHLVRSPNERLMMNMYGTDSDGNKVEIVPEYGELFRYMMVPNFFVWCCGLGYDARLFHEFQADTCLVIHDQGAFTSRLNKAVQEQHSGTKFHHGPIMYYDPYTSKREQLKWGYSKHLRYLYQNEHRFIWNVNATELQPFFVQLGPLHDIANLVELTN